jgi:hypothetical protein
VPRLAAVAAWAGVVVLVVHRLSLVHHVGDGLDLAPLVQAGHALLHGRSVYAVHVFVYPPTAAVVAAPLSVLPWTAARWLWLLASLLAVVTSTVMAARAFTRRWWWIAAPVASIVLLLSDTAIHSLVLENVSVLVLPAAVAALVSFGRRRWVLGSAIVFASLLLKPLLAPLLLLPLLQKQWRPVVVSGAPAAVVALVSVPLVPGARNLPSVVRRVAAGSALTGRQAVWNLSLFGFGVTHHLSAALVLPLRLAVVAVAVVALLRWRHLPPALATTVVAGGVALVALFLAGNLSEVHYLPLLLLPMVAVLAARPPLPAAVAATAAGVLIVLPPLLLGSNGAGAQQWRYLLGELLLFGALALTLLRPADGGTPGMKVTEKAQGAA